MKNIGTLIIIALIIWWLSQKKSAQAATATETPAGSVRYAKPIVIPVTSQAVRKVVECDTGKESSVESALRGMGITVETSYEDMIQVTMPMNKITEVAAIPGVRSVIDPQYAVAF